MNLKFLDKKIILNKRFIIFLMMLFIFSCNSNPELPSSNSLNETKEEVKEIKQTNSDDSKQKEKFGYVDWWPVSTEDEKSDNYTATTSTIKEIPFPAKKFVDPESTTK